MFSPIKGWETPTEPSSNYGVPEKNIKDDIKIYYKKQKTTQKI